MKQIPGLLQKTYKFFEDRVFATVKIAPDYKNILMFVENLKMKLGVDNNYDIQCRYEAGCLGYSLYNQLTAAGVKHVILAPTTMLTQQGVRVPCGLYFDKGR